MNVTSSYLSSTLPPSPIRPSAAVRRADRCVRDPGLPPQYRGEHQPGRGHPDFAEVWNPSCILHAGGVRGHFESESGSPVLAPSPFLCQKLLWRPPVENVKK